METALIKVFAFVCIIVAGYCMGHTGKLGTMPGEFVSKIVFTFTLPCAVLHAFGAADFSPQMLLLVPLGFVFAFGAYLSPSPSPHGPSARTARSTCSTAADSTWGASRCRSCRPSSLPPWPWPPASTMPATRS